MLKQKSKIKVIREDEPSLKKNKIQTGRSVQTGRAPLTTGR